MTAILFCKHVVFVQTIYYWAACGAQLWNGFSPSKKDKMADGTPRRRCVSQSLFNRADFSWREPVISGLLGNRFRNRFGTNINYFVKLLRPISTPNDYLKQYSMMLLNCAELKKQCRPTVPSGKALNFRNSLPACDKSYNKEICHL